MRGKYFSLFLEMVSTFIIFSNSDYSTENAQNFYTPLLIFIWNTVFRDKIWEPRFQEVVVGKAVVDLQRVKMGFLMISRFPIEV